MIPTATDGDFDQLVLADPGTVLVVFGAEWCGGSHMLSPIVEDLSAKLPPHTTIRWLDVDASPRTVAAYGVRKVPTLLFFRQGRVADQLTGAVPRQAIVARLRALHRETGEGRSSAGGCARSSLGFPP